MFGSLNHCCVCAQMCHHVGGPRYCHEHAPVRRASNNFWDSFAGATRVFQPPCDHCRCIDVEETKERPRPHLRCCKCGDERVKS